MPRRKYGWLPQFPDHRDFQYASPAPVVQVLPRAVDLIHQMPPVYDQGRIGSCTANASAALVQFLMRTGSDTPWFSASRLFIYYNTRVMEGAVGSDSGGQLRDAIKSLATLGVCTEFAWPYDDTPANDAGVFPLDAPAVKTPSRPAYTAALVARALDYRAVPQSLSQLKGCLAEGFPFCFGFTVYSSMYDQDGNPAVVVPMPADSDSVEGGHAVVAVGYDDAKQQFKIRNSWGPDAQDQGHFYLPYAYLTNLNLASDFWMIRRIAP